MPEFNAEREHALCREAFKIAADRIQLESGLQLAEPIREELVIAILELTRAGQKDAVSIANYAISQALGQSRNQS